MTNVFIDGKDGTTGLKIFERFANRNDIHLLLINQAKRKDIAERQKMIHQADICFLCLPDAAAKESVALAEGSNTRIIDTSTAHRTNPAWSYGFPELSAEHRSGIIEGNRIAVPGCHASGFNSIVYPLVACGAISKDYPFVCHSITGYSGGGKKMIAEYETANRSSEFNAPRQYALAQTHKHLPEMTAVPGLSRQPVFSPIVADYYSGMTVTVPLFSDMLNRRYTRKEIHEMLCAHYDASPMVTVLPLGAETESDGMLGSNTKKGKDTMELLVMGNDERILIASRFDNLGKGASGAAIQCMNLMLGLDETTGLVL